MPPDAFNSTLWRMLGIVLLTGNLGLAIYAYTIDDYLFVAIHLAVAIFMTWGMR